MKFDVDDKNRCRLVCVKFIKFHLNPCRFAVAVAKCLGGSLFLGQCIPVDIIMQLGQQQPGFSNCSLATVESG